MPFSPRSRLGRQAVAFSLVPAISLVTPLLVIPIVSRTYGAAGLLAVSIGQSVGAVAGIVVGLGWPLIGSALVAGSETQDRSGIYVKSLHTRGLTLLVTAPIAAIAAAVLVDGYVAVAILTAVNFSSYGLTSVWYYVGTGRAYGLVALEVVPRMIAAAFAALLLALGAPLEVYPILLQAAVVLAFVLNARSVVGEVPRPNVREAVRGIKEQAGATAARAVNAVYNGGTTSVVATFSPASALVFAAIDRTQKSAFNCFVTAPESIVSWVVGVPEGRFKRVQKALLMDVIYASGCAVLFFIFLPVAYRFLYSDLVTLTTEMRILSSLAVAALVCSRGFIVHGLLVLGHERYASIILASTSVAGAIMVAVSSVFFGASGAVGAILVAELSCIALVSIVVVSLRRSFVSEDEGISQVGY